MAARKEPFRIEQRTISGRGLVKVPQDKNIRKLFLYLQVVRLPRINFTSSKYNPDRSEYAKITWLRDDVILKEEALNFEQELHTWEQDYIAYLAYAQICMYNSIITYFEHICGALQIPLLTRNNNLYVEPTQNLPDSIKIVCRDDTAIIADLWRYDYDIACDEADSEPPPPPSPPKIDKVPEGTPIGDISPPYDSGTDNNDTVPSPGDETAPPLPPGQGEACQLVIVLFEYVTLAGETVQSSKEIYAPYYDIYVRRIGAVGVDYVEDIAIIGAIQNLDMCNNGETQIIGAGYSATVPVAQSVTFLGLG